MTPNPGQRVAGPLVPQKSVLPPRELMTEKEKLDEWLRYYKAAILKLGALQACYMTDGEKMLSSLLQELKLESSVELIKAISGERLRS